MLEKRHFITLLLIVVCIIETTAQVAKHENYLDSIKVQLTQNWPKNKIINLVFHGHSVVAGYFKTPEVQTFEAYPFLSYKAIKDKNKTAVINIINTAIGGEQSEQGAARFKAEVLSHQPDVLFIDYALNDRRIGLEKVKAAWTEMIKEAQDAGIKIILFTPTPDLNENILDINSPLEKHAEQIRELAKKYKLGLVDSYSIFKKIAQTESLDSYMAQKNHINEKGHAIVAIEIEKFF